MDTENNSSNINGNPNWQHPTAKIGEWKKNDKKGRKFVRTVFLSGNINPQDKLNAQEMHNELLKYVETEEIEEQDVPKVSTIQGWISRYAAALKYIKHRNDTLKIIAPKFAINSLARYKKIHEKKI
ncbi:hypothetical protein RhiirA4_454089 [Rhizophagus irregularis]|uniref:Uncharacterized protein n=1 Tax=Rhizophagus irregularis TaxID=588596 RepID=A0A2I1G202_9GLOM|nr:hypothetical protein RhiirA4_454089 [Rhizophagus irregularis]